MPAAYGKVRLSGHILAAPFGVELNLDVMGFSVLHKAGVKPDEEVLNALVLLLEIVQALLFLGAGLAEYGVFFRLRSEGLSSAPGFKQPPGEKGSQSDQQEF